MDHHECSPSSLYRRSMCYGSMQAERGMTGETSADAEEGTLLHEAMWLDDVEHLSIDQQKLLSMANSALNTIAVKYGVEEWKGEKRGKLIRSGKVLTYGYMDAYGKGADGRWVVVDFKFGFKEVPSPAENLQLAAYSAILAQITGAKEVTACIIQPRVMGSKFTEYTYKRFEDIERHIEHVVNENNRYNPPKEAGKWCEYCKALHVCEESEKMKNEIAEVSNSDITIHNADEIYEKALVVEKMIKKVKSKCRKVAEQNDGQAGRLHIVEKNGARFIPNLQSAYESFQDLFTVEEFLGFCSASIGKLEDAAARKLKAAKQVETIIDGKRLFEKLANIQNKPATTTIKIKG